MPSKAFTLARAGETDRWRGRGGGESQFWDKCGEGERSRGKGVVVERVTGKGEDFF